MDQTFLNTVKNHSINLDVTAGNAPESLISLCTDLFLIIMNIRDDIDMGDITSARKMIISYIDLYENNCKSLNISSDIIEKVKFALVVTIDSKFHQLPNKWSNNWDSLENQLFKIEVSEEPFSEERFEGEHHAGERFFEYLEELVKYPERNNEAIEIFYLCLAMGFQGKYYCETQKLEQKIVETAKCILESRRIKKPSLSTQEKILKPKSSRKAVPHVSNWVLVLITLGIISLSWISAFITSNYLSEKTIPTLTIDNQ